MLCRWCALWRAVVADVIREIEPRERWFDRKEMVRRGPLLLVKLLEKVVY